MVKQIIVADDHPLFRSAISNLLSHLDAQIIVTEVEDCTSLNSLLKESSSQISLVLLDLKLPDTKGIEGLLSLKKNFPALPIVIVSAYDDDKLIQNAMQFGASGFIPKNLDMPEMAQAITEILEGELWFPQISEKSQNSTEQFNQLTTTQIKVLTLLKEGKPNKEMANLMNITEATVKAHLTEVYRKLNVTNRTQAVVIAKKLDTPEFEIGK